MEKGSMQIIGLTVKRTANQIQNSHRTSSIHQYEGTGAGDDPSSDCSSDGDSRDGSHRKPHAGRNVGILVEVGIIIVRLVVAVILARVPT